jgi:hypothetical protein
MLFAPKEKGQGLVEYALCHLFCLLYALILTLLPDQFFGGTSRFRTCDLADNGL